MKRELAGSLALVFSLSSAAAAQAAPAHLGIEDVARLAVETGPALKAARERVTAAEEQTRSARGRLLPSIHVSDEYQRWDSPFRVSFSPPGAPAGDPIVLRGLDTNTFSVGARQPLLGLLRGTAARSARAISAEAAKVGVAASESALREAVELEYLRLFEAKARSEIARTSAQELAQEVSETEARVKAGTLTNADLLRVRVAEATARQQGIVADTDALVSRANLLTAIGRSPDDDSTEFELPAALLAQTDAPVPPAVDAVARRPEVREAALRAEAAAKTEDAQLYALLPEVDLEAGYAHVNGQQFAPRDSAFVGVKADWAIWEWGATYAGKAAAAAEARAATHEVDASRRRVLAEVAARRAELGAAMSAVALARQTITSAEEAYRVTEAQVRAGVSTTTDLLNAASALNEARLRLENARYAQAAARIRLQHASGTR